MPEVRSPLVFHVGLEASLYLVDGHIGVRYEPEKVFGLKISIFSA